ncbi:MAG: lactonase family protein [Acidobacteriaceae bacterium]
MDFHRPLRTTLRGVAVVLVAAVPAMTGCNGFFIPECQAYNTTCPTTTTTTTTTTPAATSRSPIVGVSSGSSMPSFVYVSDPSTGSIGGFSLNAGHLVPTPAIATPPGLSSRAVSATPQGNLLYSATVSVSIYLYRIASDGSLRLGHGGAAVAQVSGPIQMSVDQSGKWLFVASSNPSQLQEFRVDAAKGTLQPASPSTIALSAGTITQMGLSPDNRNLFVALGTGGVDAFPFDPSSGTTGARLHTAVLPTAYSQDSALTSDNNSRFLFVGEKGSGIRVLRIVADGVLKEISGSPFLPHGNPSSLTVGPANQHLFVADHDSHSIRELLIGQSGSLTPVSTIAFTAEASPTALSLDATGHYLVALPASNPSAAQLFRLGSGATGALQSQAVSPFPPSAATSAP